MLYSKDGTTKTESKFKVSESKFKVIFRAEIGSFYYLNPHTTKYPEIPIKYPTKSQPNENTKSNIQKPLNTIKTNPKSNNLKNLTKVCSLGQATMLKFSATHPCPSCCSSVPRSLLAPAPRSLHQPLPPVMKSLKRESISSR